MRCLYHCVSRSSLQVIVALLEILRFYESCVFILASHIKAGPCISKWNHENKYFQQIIRYIFVLSDMIFT